MIIIKIFLRFFVLLRDLDVGISSDSEEESDDDEEELTDNAGTACFLVLGLVTETFFSSVLIALDLGFAISK